MSSMPTADSHDVERTDCAIIGGGAPGLLLAGLLGRIGWDVMVLERTASLARGTRGVVLHPGTLQIFEQMGLLASLIERGLQLTGFQEIRHRRVVIDHRYEQFTSEGVAFALTVPLGSLLELLESYAKMTPTVGVIHGCEVIDASQGPGAVAELRVLSDHERWSVAAKVIVAADGKRSVLRSAVGISHTVTPYDQRHLMVRTPRPADWPPVLRAYTAPAFVFVAPGQDDRLYLMVEVASDDNPFRDAGTLHDHLAAVAPELGRLDVGDYQPDRAPVVAYDAVAADSWHTGNLVLLGDSAHAVHSFGGQGMNLGLQDATILADVLDGCLTAGNWDGLDRFDTIRKPWVDHFVGRLAAGLEGADNDSPRYADVLNDMSLGQPAFRPWAVTALARHRTV